MAQKNRLLSVGLRLLTIQALVVGLLFPTMGMAAQIEIGKKVVQGMKIRVWLEKPQKMQMLMKGMWMTYRPQAGALTHHLGVDLIVPENGARIPYAKVSTTLTNSKSGKKTVKKLPAMFGKRLFYGANLKLAPGKYDLVVRVNPPTLMRMEGAMNKWVKPIEAKFTLTVK